MIRLLALFVALCVVALLSVGIGASDVGFREVLDVLRGGGDDTTRAIVLNLRVPRVVLAALVGAALALSGSTFQALLRNPLADPYVLGVSGGSAVGAVLVLVLGIGGGALWALPLGAFLGALVAIVVVLQVALASARGRLDARVLILSGVIVAAFFNAVILLFLSIADDQSFRSAIFWMMGNLSGATWGANALLLGHLVVLGTILLSSARSLNLLARGENVAFHLGVPVQRAKRVAYLATSLLVAATVAVSGVIGFVGLIVPHGIRLAWGGDHRMLLPASILGGAAFLILTDTLARVVIAPGELPTGVVTALVGVPLFVVLLVRQGRGEV